MAPNTFWLNSARYLEEKRAIAIEFSNKNSVVSKRFSFFPEMHLPKTIPMASLLGVFSPKKFRVVEEKNCFRIIASAFSDLQSIAQKISAGVSFHAKLIEPERQFLIQKNWGYFDAFEIGENRIRKTDFFGIPETKTALLAETVPETLEALLVSGQKNTAEFLSDKIILSGLLKIKIEKTDQVSDPEMVFLENLLFKNKISAVSEKEAENNYSSVHANTGSFSAEIDFSETLALLLTNSYYNLGFETIDCNCCKPEAISGKNLLPSSLVSAEFFSDGFFFESLFQDFSNEFHENNPNRESRERRKREFFLPNFPVGPFFRLEQKAIPLADAAMLSKKGKCRIVAPYALHWFCEKQESFVSRAIKEIREKVSFVSLALSEAEIAHTKKFGLFCSDALSKNMEFVFFSRLKKNLEQVFCSLPVLLTRHGFFPLASAVGALQALEMQRFREFGVEKGFGRVIVSGEKAFVATDFALQMVSDFSEKESIPAPIVVSQKIRKKQVL